MVLDIQKREQLPCAQIMRIELQYLLELENRDIEIVGIAALERVIIASDRRCNIRDHLRAFIEHPQITVRKIVLFMQAFVVDALADDPLAESRNAFPDFKIAQSQQISRLQIVLVEPQALFQRFNRAGNVTDLCSFKARVIHIVGSIYNFLVLRNVYTAVRTMV